MEWVRPDVVLCLIANRNCFHARLVGYYYYLFHE